MQSAAELHRTTDRFHPDIFLGEEHEAVVAVGGAPRVFGNEEEGAVATAAHKTDEGHAMVVGGEATSVSAASVGPTAWQTSPCP